MSFEKFAPYLANPLTLIGFALLLLLAVLQTVLNVLKQDSRGKAVNRIFMYGFTTALFVIGLGFASEFLRNHRSADARGHANVILRLHGSNTIGQELGPALAEGFLKSLGAKKLARRPTGRPDELVVEGWFPGESQPRGIEIEAHGSATAFIDLKLGSCDIGMSSRQITAAERADAGELGDLSSPGGENVIALDGVAVIVNPANPVRSLTLTQLRGIFSGEIKNWTAVGGEPGAIRILARDDASGTSDLFKTLAMSNRSLAAGAARLEGSAELSKQVAEDKSAIGYVGLPYVRNSKAVAISGGEEIGAGSLSTPILPTSFSVATEEYPLARRLYLYAAVAPTNPYVSRFVRFAKSATGQELVSKTNFVPLKLNLERRNPQELTPVEPVPTSSDPQTRYRDLVAGATRLNVSFRFRSNSFELDSRALDDVNRVADLLRDLNYDQAHLVLIGFTDGLGSEEANCRLSLDRANALGYSFAKHDIRAAQIQGMCSALPLANNDSERGRQINRRVEVWVK
jgi:phosphate transport system substrate-binding protein